MEKVLDYEPRAETRRYPCGADIACTLDRIVAHYAVALPTQVVDAVRRDAARLHESPSQALAPGIRGDHRLASFKHSAPIYAACFAEGPETWDDLLTPARLALLLHLFDPSDLKPKPSVASLSDICRNWRNTGEPDDRIRINKSLAPSIRDLNWAGARVALGSLRHLFKTSSTIQNRLGALNSALRILENRQTPGPSRPSAADSRGIRQIASVFTPYVTPTTVMDPLAELDAPDGESSVWIRPPNDLEPRLERATPTQRAVVARRGYRMQMRRRLGLCSDEALYPDQARRVMDCLLALIDAAEPRRYVAASLWLLAAVTGQRIDSLVYPLLDESPDTPVRPTLELHVAGAGAVLVVPYLNAERLPAGAACATTRDTYELALPAAIVPLVVRSREVWQSTPPRETLDAFIQSVKTEQQAIRAALRREIDLLTETRIRGSLLQAIFGQSLDLPVTQVFAHEPLEASLAPLHYMALKQEQLQEIYNTALTNLYGTRFAPAHNPQPDQWIGAPRARQALAGLPRLAASLSQFASRRAPRRRDSERLASHHNALCDLTAVTLLVATGHRGNRNFGMIRATDLSPSARCIIYSDKANDPATFRRLAVLPTAVRDQLYRYRRHLQRLSSDDGVGLPPEIRASIGRAHEGSEPLFFRIERQDSGWTIQTWRPRDAWERHAPTDLPVNAARHALSTNLRQQGVSGLWIEAHLGHASEASLFGKSGLVSCLEFASIMDGPLTRFLAHLGLPCKMATDPQRSSCRWDRPAALSNALAQRERRILAEDAERSRRLQGFEGCPPGTQSIQDAIDNGLRTHDSNYARHRPPHDLHLTETQIKAIAEEILKRVGNPGDTHAALNQFKGRLAYHRALHAWRLYLPERLHRYTTEPLAMTPASLEAYEQVCGLRVACERHLSRAVADRTAMTALALALALWGTVTEPAALVELMNALPDARRCHEQAILMVPIPQPDGRDITHSLTGIAAAAAIGHLNSLGDRPPQIRTVQALSRRVWRLLPTDYRPKARERTLSDLGGLIRLARMIEAPGLLASVESGQISSRQLPAARLGRWHDNGVSPAALSAARPEQAIQFPRPAQAVGAADERTAYRELLGVLRGTGPRRQTRRSIRHAVERWLTQQSIPPLTALLAQWAWHLAGPGSNLRTGGELAVRTIHAYISTVRKPLFKGLDGIEPADLDVELLHECLAHALSANADPERPTESLARREADRLNRMFADLRSYIDLPPLALHAPGGVSGTAAIDANVINPAEFSLVIRTLEQGASDAARGLEQRRALTELADAMTWIHASGMRRSEATYLRNQDLTFSDQVGHLVIRANPDRSLKSTAARRALEIRNLSPPIRESHALPTEPVWPRLSQPTALPDTLAFGTLLLRAATDDPHLRLHHLRHTRATRGFEEAFALEPFARVIAIHRLSAGLGHAAISSTATHYAHTLQELSSSRYQPAVTSIGQAALAQLLATRHATLRRRLSRAGADPKPRAKALLRLESAAQPRPQTHAGPLALPDDVVSPPSPLTPDETIHLLYSLARGQSLMQILTDISIAQQPLIQLLRLTRALADEIGWSPISQQRLAYELSRFNVASGPPDTTRGKFPITRRVVLSAPIKRWRERIRAQNIQAPVPDVGNYLTGFQWRAQAPTCVLASQKLADSLKRRLSEVCAPLQTFQAIQPSGSVKLNFEIPGAESTQTVSATVRFVLYCVLFLARQR